MKIQQRQLKWINGIAIFLAIAFMFTLILYSESVMIGLKSIIMLFLVFVYSKFLKRTSIFLIATMSCFALANILTTVQYIKFDRIIYYVVTVINILGYILLSIYILRMFNFKELFSKFYPYIIVLIILNVYMLYTLNTIIEVDSSKYMTPLAVVFESLYNIGVLAILTLSLLNYMYQEYSREALYLLLACMGISFSDIVQLFYLYTEEYYGIFVSHSILELVAYFFLFRYIILKGGFITSKPLEGN